jgi:hypothetical protein
MQQVMSMTDELPDALLCLMLLLAISTGKGRAQVHPSTPDFEEHHCSESSGTADGLVACQVWNDRPELVSHPRKIEIYRQGKLLLTLGTGTQILEWHFWNDGKQLAVHFGHPGSFALYETGTGRVLTQFSQTVVSSKLPEWAKPLWELADEAVPEGPVFDQQRTAWIAKLLRQIETIQPGMKRKDLPPTLTTEGGMSTRDQQTYVSSECPYIKVNVRFRPVGKGPWLLNGSPEDIIESMSKPYLDWGTMD